LSYKLEVGERQSLESNYTLTTWQASVLSSLVNFLDPSTTLDMFCVLISLFTSHHHADNNYKLVTQNTVSIPIARTEQNVSHKTPTSCRHDNSMSDSERLHFYRRLSLMLLADKLYHSRFSLRPVARTALKVQSRLSSSLNFHAKQFETFPIILIKRKWRLFVLLRNGI